MNIFPCTDKRIHLRKEFEVMERQGDVKADSQKRHAGRAQV